MRIRRPRTWRCTRSPAGGSSWRGISTNPGARFIILEHVFYENDERRNLTSLYARLAEIRVREGEFVSRRQAVATAGLLLMVGGFIARVLEAGVGPVLIATGGTLSALGAYTFVYLIWRTIDGPAEMRKASERAARAVERGLTRGDRTLTVVAMRSGAGGS